MARLSTYGTGTLTITLTEGISLNSRDYGSTQTFTLPNIANVNRRIATVTQTEVTLISFASAMGAGTHIPAKVKYIRFTNLDDDNHVTLTIQNDNSDEFQVKIDASQSYVILGDNSGGMVEAASANIVNLGMQAFTDATCDYNNDPTIACDASASIKKGMLVTGTGIPADSTVASVNIPGAVTSFELSASTTGGNLSNQTLTFTPQLHDLSTIKADADTGSCDLEIFMAEIA